MFMKMEIPSKKIIIENFKSILYIIVLSTPDSIGNITDIKTFSSEQKLYRVTSYIIRFIENLKRCQNKSNTVLLNYLTIEELHNAKLLW